MEARQLATSIDGVPNSRAGKCRAPGASVQIVDQNQTNPSGVGGMDGTFTHQCLGRKLDARACGTSLGGRRYLLEQSVGLGQETRAAAAVQTTDTFAAHNYR